MGQKSINFDRIFSHRHHYGIILSVVFLALLVGLAMLYQYQKPISTPTAPPPPSSPDTLKSLPEKIQIPERYEKMCRPFPKTTEKVGCREAVFIFSETFSGEINSINRTKEAISEGQVNDFWAFDMSLTKPISFRTPQGSTQRSRVLFLVDVNTGAITPYGI